MNHFRLNQYECILIFLLFNNLNYVNSEIFQETIKTIRSQNIVNKTIFKKIKIIIMTYQLKTIFNF